MTIATDKADKIAELKSGLAGFTGSINWYRHWLPNCIYSDGAKFLADKTECYWLLDVLFSFRRKVLANPVTNSFCFWTMTLNDPEGKTANDPDIETDYGAKLQCWEDTDKKAFRISQKIPFTDFPLSTIKLYMSYDGRYLKVFLPSEY